MKISIKSIVSVSFKSFIFFVKSNQIFEYEIVFKTVINLHLFVNIIKSICDTLKKSIVILLFSASFKTFQEQILKSAIISETVFSLKNSCIYYLTRPKLFLY